MAPLSGRRIVVTRRSRQAGPLSEMLRELGAAVIEVPAIEIAPPPDLGPLDAALSALDRYAWVVLTSPNAVSALLSRLTVLGVFPRLGGPRRALASVGPATTAALRASFPEDTVPVEPGGDYRAAGLLAAFAGRPLGAKRVLLPTSTAARGKPSEMP